MPILFYNYIICATVYPHPKGELISGILKERRGFMLLENIREDIVEYSRRLITSGLTVGTGGNISVFDPDTGLFAITPSGVDYFQMEAGDIVVCDLQGKIVEGVRKPSSETELHRIFYERRPDIHAVVHAHSTYCTVLATNRMELPASSYLVAFAGKNVRCGEYASFGTKERAEKTFAAMEDRNAALMANHGLITGADSLLRAFDIAQQIEFCAKVYVKALSIGKPFILDDREMERMSERFSSYGQQPAGDSGKA